MLLVKCPHCGNNQKTNPARIANAKKLCVYCGRSFMVHSLQKDRIVKILQK